MAVAACAHRYEVDIFLEDQYPFVPPKMRFVTKVGGAPRVTFMPMFARA